MKIALIGLSVCAVVCVSVAQPSITSSTSPQPGDVATGTLADTTGWNPGASGAKKTWNFTNLTAAGSGEVSWVAPAGTPYAASFTNSNLVMVQLTSYSYFNSTSDIYENVGLGNDNITVTMNNPQTVITYPFTFLDSLSDTAKGTYVAPAGITGHRTIYSKTVADGYGTLKLPGAVTYTNALRIKVVSQAFDSVFYNSVFVNRPEKDYTEYYWAVPGIRPWVYYMQRVLSVSSGITTESIMITSPIANTGIMGDNINLKRRPHDAAVTFSHGVFEVSVADDFTHSDNATLSVYASNGSLARRFAPLTSPGIENSSPKISPGIYVCRLEEAHLLVSLSTVTVY